MHNISLPDHPKDDQFAISDRHGTKRGKVIAKSMSVPQTQNCKHDPITESNVARLALVCDSSSPVVIAKVAE